jgi:outer membrane cobalamin receptor
MGSGSVASKHLDTIGQAGSVVAGLSICLVLVAHHAHAAAPPTVAAQNRVLDEVVVESTRVRQASRAAQDAAALGNAVQIVTAEEISQGGYSNIAEAMQQLVRGANVGYSPDEGEYTIRLDGGGDRDTLVVLDGVPLFDRGPALEDIWGSTTIDPHMVERIEIFRGGNSLFYGSNGGIGVVSIVTKRPDGTTKGEFGVSYGSFNSRELWGNYSFPLGERHSFMFYGSSHNTDGPRIFRPEDFVDNVAAAGGIQEYPLNRNNIGAKYLFAIDSSSELRINAQYTQIEFQDAFPGTEVHSPNTTQYPIIDVSYQKRWSDKLLTEASAYYSNPQLFNTELYPEICRVASGCVDPNNPARIIPRGAWTGAVEPFPNKGFGKSNQFKAGFKEMGLSVRNVIDVAEWLQIVPGVQVVRYQDDSDPIFPVDDDVATVTGVYLDVRPRLPFSPGTALSIAARQDFSSDFEDRTIWKFGARQSMGGAFYARANGGTSYSLPRNNELFSDSPTLIGNPNLQTEETETYSAAVGVATTLAGRRFAAEVGMFSTDISNRIQTTAGLTPNTYFNNEAITEIRGITADVEMRISSMVDFSLSYTKQDSVPASGPLKDTQINETPEWFVNGSLNFRSPSNRYQLSLLPRYQGPEWSTGGVSVNGVPMLRHNFGEYFVLNATAAVLAGERQQHRFQLRFVNILDEEYAERYGYVNMLYSEAYNAGRIALNSPEYFKGYPFEGKPRAAYVSYQLRF